MRRDCKYVVSKVGKQRRDHASCLALSHAHMDARPSYSQHDTLPTRRCTQVRLPMDEQRRLKGIAYVVFEHAEDKVRRR